MVKQLSPIACHSTQPLERLLNKSLDIGLNAILLAFAIAAIVVASQHSSKEDKNTVLRMYTNSEEEVNQSRTFYNFRNSLMVFGIVNVTFLSILFILVALDLFIPQCSGKDQYFNHRNQFRFIMIPFMLILLVFNVYWGISAVSAYQIAESVGDNSSPVNRLVYACGIYSLIMPVLLIILPVVFFLVYITYIKKK